LDIIEDMIVSSRSKPVFKERGIDVDNIKKIIEKTENKQVIDLLEKLIKEY
jgi:hypothetical protein